MSKSWVCRGRISDRMADSLAIDPSGLWRGKSKRERERERGRTGREREIGDGWVDGGMDTTSKKQRDQQEEGKEGGEKKRYRDRKRKG